MIPALLTNTSMPPSFTSSQLQTSSAAALTAFRLERSRRRVRAWTEGTESLRREREVESVEVERPARMRSFGSCGARARAVVSPRPLGDTPVIRKVLCWICWENAEVTVSEVVEASKGEVVAVAIVRLSLVALLWFFSLSCVVCLSFFFFDLMNRPTFVCAFNWYAIVESLAREGFVLFTWQDASESEE
ncbi:unnamed protein product [Periconia digitata]|uniref:Uncharacterized protein n=1 Tax=Periconia digitata TaxID=1303443 RepID=A0A9W4XYP6_9PLEO|nr:unnamed protein product [Periconia digitata]